MVVLTHPTTMVSLTSTMSRYYAITNPSTMTSLHYYYDVTNHYYDVTTPLL